MAHRVRKSANAPPDLPGEQSPEVSITRTGDIFLLINDSRTDRVTRYYCSRNILRSSSEYFRVLLDPEKFSEGIAIEAQLQDIYKTHGGPIRSKLPTVIVSDFGDLPNASLPTSTVVCQFLKILHDPATPWPVDRSRSVELAALLAIIADRLAANTIVAEYMRGRLLDVKLLKNWKLLSTRQAEIESRQKLLAGMTLGFPQWVLQCSAALIVNGSSRWQTAQLDTSREENTDDEEALWWNLPGGLEGWCPCDLHVASNGRY